MPGLTYDSETDTIQGKVIADIENGVYDLRFNITTNTDGRTVTFKFRIFVLVGSGGRDSTPPK